MNKFIVVIPARGGSKRIPKKNIFQLLGKPLICYCLEKIKILGWEGITYVSSDNDEIGSITESLDIKFHKRPSRFANDNSSTESAIINLLETYYKKNNLPEFIITLPPTSPLLKVNSIIESLKKFESNYKKFDSLITVTKTKMDLWHYDKKNFQRIFPDAPRSQQERDPIYEENSAIYITKVSALLNTKSILGNSTIPFEIPQKEACDINTIQDIQLAEFFLKNDNI